MPRMRVALSVNRLINPTSGPIKRWCSGHANEAKVLVEQPCRYSDLVIALHPSAHYDSPSRPSTNPNHSPLASPPSPPLATPIRALSPEALSYETPCDSPLPPNPGGRSLAARDINRTGTLTVARPWIIFLPNPKRRLVAMAKNGSVPSSSWEAGHARDAP